MKRMYKPLRETKCPKCGKKGTLTLRLTISKGIRYRYYYVQHVLHNEKRKTKWCYLGKYKDLPDDIRELIPKESSYTQKYTQTTGESENPKSSFNSRIVAGGVGFEPTTTSLGGLRPILSRLPVLRYD